MTTNNRQIQQRQRDNFVDVTHKSLQPASIALLSLARSDWSIRDRLCMNCVRSLLNMRCFLLGYELPDLITVCSVKQA